MKRTLTHTLRGSGITIEAAQPNTYQLALSNLKDPTPMTRRVLELLEGYGLLPTATQKQREQYTTETLLAAIELASLFLIKPKLVLDREPDEAAGEVGPDAFVHSDWGEILALFRGNIKPATDQDSQSRKDAGIMDDESGDALPPV